MIILVSAKYLVQGQHADVLEAQWNTLDEIDILPVTSSPLDKLSY